MNILCINHTIGCNADIELLINGVSYVRTHGYTGLGGMNKAYEGDMKTPTGDFGIITAFGIKDNPGTALPYIHITDSIYCCSDKKYYNKIIDINEAPHKCHGEHMSEYIPEYSYGIFFDYNRERIYNKGSAVFIHCSGNKAYTSGCVAINETELVKILRIIDLDTRITIK